MTVLIIGHRGFVGGNLVHHYPEAIGAGRVELQQLNGQTFSHIFCAAPQAKKWWANQNPQLDRKEVDQLISACKTLSCTERFVLFSTVDVYDPPSRQDEHNTPSLEAHPYGAHRFQLEEEIKEWLGDRARIIRLPALVGKGLKKNIVFDLLNDNNINQINAQSAFQWFNLDKLPDMIDMANNLLECQVMNVVSEPLPTTNIVERWFPNRLDDLNWDGSPITYDIRTIHGSADLPYLYTKEEVLEEHLDPFINCQK